MYIAPGPSLLQDKRRQVIEQPKNQCQAKDNVHRCMKATKRPVTLKKARKLTPPPCIDRYYTHSFTGTYSDTKQLIVMYIPLLV